MLNLIPQPKRMVEKGGFISVKTISVRKNGYSERIKKALDKLPVSRDGLRLKLNIGNGNGEWYMLSVNTMEIVLEAESEKGAFYGLQTLRQIFTHKVIPCVYIEDEPDFEYRGFYHDVTRGKIPKVETAKKLIDEMAYYKLNSLQFYVEHTFEFEEYKDSIEKTGYLTAQEIKEIDDYCYENFIEFIPSLSTFGHLYELLQKEKYKHLCEIENYEPKEIFWYNRMSHHTIDPTQEESFKIIKSLIDQYIPLFRSDKFNICCDETFDLKNGRHKRLKSEELYIDFVNKIINYVQSKGKKIMMWADVLLERPEIIDRLPDGIEFLNWNYDENPPEEIVETLSKLNKPQIVCPGTNSWSRFSECIKVEEDNIPQMVEYGKKHGAKGVLNTNWGDWGNPCSLELSMYGLALGAEKSWSAETKINEEFRNRVNFLLYKNEKGFECLSRLSGLQKLKGWEAFAKYYSNLVYENKFEIELPKEDEVLYIQSECQQLINELAGEIWVNDEYRQELIVAAGAVELMAELMAKREGYAVSQKINTKEWLKDYRRKWLEKNKETELCEIEKVFLYMNKM